MFRLAKRRFSFGQPAIMAIVNVTPDSFSDGGSFPTPHSAIEHGLSLVEQGADILDIGGASSRPGAVPLTAQQEIERVAPVIEGLRKYSDVPISIDTYQAATAKAALLAGADIINDISAGADPAMLPLAAGHGCALVLMHMQGTPATMQKAPFYDDVCAQVAAFLEERVWAALHAGIAREHLILDPGIGFGKTAEHNLALMGGLSKIVALGLPVLLGISRKKTLEALTGEPFGGVGGNLAGNLWGVSQGVKLLRVHEVKTLKQALRVWGAIQGARGNA